MCRSLISVSKLTHQVLHDHPFSQRNKATKRAVGVEVGGNGERLDKIWQYRGWGGDLYKIGGGGGVRFPLPTTVYS